MALECQIKSLICYQEEKTEVICSHIKQRQYEYDFTAEDPEDDHQNEQSNKRLYKITSANSGKKTS